MPEVRHRKTRESYDQAVVRNMTAIALVGYLNQKYGLGEWPRTLEVDAITYANCCQFVFNRVNENLNDMVQLGVENNGLLYKNIELIYNGEQ